MFNEELKTGSDEMENLSEEHQKLCRMCGDLKRVNAPKNFDLHLKARIANCDKSDFQTNPLLPFLRYAVPLSVILLLAGFVVFSGILSGNQNAETTLAQNVQPLQANDAAVIVPEKTETKISETAQTSPNSNSASTANTESPKAVSNTQTPTASNKTELAPSANKNLLLGEDFGGSRTSSSRESKIINPPGIKPKQNSASVSEADMSNNSRSSVKELLNLNGIEANFVNSGWKVKSIAANSVASRTKLKIGDVIESAGSLKFNTEIITEPNLIITSLQVLRDGKRITVEFR